MTKYSWLMVVLILAGCQSTPITAPPATKTVAVNGATLTYLEQGAGTPVVFLHGAFSDHRTWEGQRNAVAAGHRFIALSMRYFGTAPWPDDAAMFSQATHVADLAAFIRQLNVGPVILVGLSYGGSVAAITAVQHPDLVKGLFLTEPPLGGSLTSDADRAAVAEDVKGLAAVREAVKAGDNPKATKLFYEFVIDLPGAFEALPAARQTMLMDNARTVPPTFRPGIPLTCQQLSQLKVPVAVVKGALTRAWFRLTAESTSRCVPGARLITVANARHTVSAEQPQAFNNELLRFLSGL